MSNPFNFPFVLASSVAVTEKHYRYDVSSLAAQGSKTFLPHGAGG